MAEDLNTDISGPISRSPLQKHAIGMQRLKHIALPQTELNRSSLPSILERLVISFGNSRRHRAMLVIHTERSKITRGCTEAIEAQTIDSRQMFGEMKVSEITRQLAYALYEQNVVLRGHDSANKAMSAWAAAFRYGMHKFLEITLNPFSEHDKLSSAPRRQRWTELQLDSFIKKADEAPTWAPLAMRPFMHGTHAAAWRYPGPEMGCV